MMGKALSGKLSCTCTDLVNLSKQKNPILNGGWSGGAMELGKLPVPGCHTYLDDSRARAY